jgi:hypothetical protein
MAYKLWQPSIHPTFMLVHNPSCFPSEHFSLFTSEFQKASKPMVGSEKNDFHSMPATSDEHLLPDKVIVLIAVPPH